MSACQKCLVILPVDHFDFKRCGKQNANCRACLLIRKTWRDNNKEELKAYQKEYQKAYREQHRERHREQQKVYREQNREHIKKCNKKYYQNNLEKIKAHQNKKTECPCGGRYTHVYRRGHFETLKHMKYEETCKSV